MDWTKTTLGMLLAHIYLAIGIILPSTPLRAFRSAVESHVSKGGASGALFFKSHCDRFIVKSCTAEEMRTLRRIAPLLQEHFQENPKSLLGKVSVSIYLVACRLTDVMLRPIDIWSIQTEDVRLW